MKYAGLSILAGLGLFGCAKFPTTVPEDSTRLIFRMTVAGEIKDGYVYVIPIRVSNDPNPTGDGPNPVLSFPNANGFVSGNADYFIMWEGNARQYTLYKFDDPSLTHFTAIGVPLNTITISDGSKTLGFELAAQQLSTVVDGWKDIKTIQVNFMAMNRLLNGSTTNWFMDCLGDANLVSDTNSPVKIPILTSSTYDNARSMIEPASSDCPIPDLDITDWSIEVRRQ